MSNYCPFPPSLQDPQDVAEGVKGDSELRTSTENNDHALWGLRHMLANFFFKGPGSKYLRLS